ncbi:hypothetical protein C2845_PM02G08780 [Panicum miliaceum]|uniref:4-hydroxyphenylacetaldehyde oxime monooxygenase-like n=1 Tax=Panicum miliaceum TaxID=4540 RepID=A0A3L6SBQ0_PANMI|nr:hypothetical protein C2845_PM02G08780 [Panicum miliaceum]
MEPKITQELVNPQQWRWQLQPSLVLVLLPLVALLLLHRRKSNSTLRLPPGPWRLPVIGNLHQIGALPHRSLRALAQRHGPVMMLRLGTVPAVVLSSPEAARHALKTHDADCCGRPPSAGPRLLSYGYKDVAFSPYSDYVRDMRRVFVLELLSMRRVQAARSTREAQVEKLVGDLARGGATPVAIHEHVFAAVDGIVGAFAFGETYAAEQFKGEFIDVINESLALLSSFSAEDFFPGAAGRMVDRLTGLASRRDKIFRKLDGFFEHVLDQHLDPARAKPDGDDGSSRSHLVQELIDLWREHGATKGITRDHVKAILMDTFVGGNNTSSVTMHWAMSELLRHPLELKKVQDEIRAAVAVSQELVRHDDMPKLRYLRMVVKETLRLHPPATLLVPRQTTRRIKVGGYDIPADTKVIVNAWAIGRVPGQRRRLQRRALRAPALRRRPPDLPGAGDGRGERGVHPGQLALLLRLGAAGRGARRGREHGGGGSTDVPQENSADGRANKVP